MLKTIKSLFLWFLNIGPFGLMNPPWLKNVSLLWSDLSNKVQWRRHPSRAEGGGSGEHQLSAGLHWWVPRPWRTTVPPHQNHCLILCMTGCLLCFADENSNQSFLSDVYQPSKADNNSSSTSSSQQVSPPHTSSLRAEDSQPPMLGQESVDGESLWPTSIDFGRFT